MANTTPTTPTYETHVITYSCGHQVKVQAPEGAAPRPKIHTACASCAKQGHIDGTGLRVRTWVLSRAFAEASLQSRRKAETVRLGVLTIIGETDKGVQLRATDRRTSVDFWAPKSALVAV